MVMFPVSILRELREHCERLNARMATVETELHHHKEQNASLNRKVEKHKAQNQKRNEKVANQKDSATEELREEELAELRKVRRALIFVSVVHFGFVSRNVVGDAQRGSLADRSP